MTRLVPRLAVALAAFVALAGPAAAQTLPSMKFKRGALVAPASALTFYGAGGHTNGLPEAAFAGRPPEIVEAARALKNDPDLMFQFVRDHVRTEFAFGTRKGALGALIDRSGTPFDQAVLLVELARQGGLQARYRIGQIEMPLTAFQAWSEVGDLTAACRMLADAGIPGECLTVSGTPTVRLLHAWTEIQISGTWYVFDPSLKGFSPVAPRNVQTGAGLVSGAAATQLESGADAPGSSPAPYIRNLNTSALDSYLKARGGALLTDVVQNAPAADTEEVTGRPKIAQVYKPAGGWRLTAPQGYTVVGTALTITGDLPNSYRTTLRVEVINAFLQTAAVIDRTLYSDEIYGRRLELDSDFDRDHITSPQAYYNRSLRLQLDGVPLVTYTNNCTGPSSSCVPGVAGDVRLTVDHPYHAANDTYGDDTVTKSVSLALPVALLHGYGEVSPAMAAKWGGERAEDKALPLRVAGNYACDPSYKCNPEFEQRAGDFAREKMAANWLAQFSRMFELQTRISGTVGQHHHSIGVVAARYNLDSTSPQPLAQPPVYDYVVSDQYTALDIDTAVSLSSKTNDAAKVRAVSRAVALSAAVLEGSVVEQAQDLPDGTSTASRFAWANRPDEDPCNAGPRRFYNYVGVSNLVPLTVAEGSENGCTNALPTVSATQVGLWQGRLEQAIGRFQTQSFNQIVSSAESFLGPGWRVGPEGAPTCGGGVCGSGAYQPTRQRGGAIIGTKTDANGDILEIAHVVTDSESLTKGGGGKSPAQQANYDPAKAADILKDRFVDRSSVLGVDLKTGAPGYTTPVLNSVGSGELPYKLDFQLTYKAGVACGSTYNFGPCFGPRMGGWVSNWALNFSLSGAGLEAMGQTTPRGAAGTLAAFWVMQDIYADTSRSELQRDVYAALVGDWWRRQMVRNVATLTQGASGRQHVLQVDGSWFSTDRAAARLVQTTPSDTTPVKVRDMCEGQSISTRRWQTTGVNFQLRNPQGDAIDVVPWTATYGANPCNVTYGFRITQWAWPSGQRLDFSHNAFGDVTSLTTTLGRSVALPESQFTVLGRSAGLDYANPRFFNAAGELTRYEEVAPTARLATQRPIPYPRLSRIYAPVKDAAGLVTAGADLGYVYDSVGKVSEAWDATALQWVGTRDPHRFLILDGARGERVDPTGGRYKVDYDPDGDPVRVLDELDRQTLATFDGRHRLTERTFPEGDKEQFAYDDSDNTTSLVRLAKPGSPAPTSLAVSATWDPTWNKIATITDTAGRLTKFLYYDASFGAAVGQLQFVVRPAAASGGTQPVYAYEYDGRGLLSKTYDPTGRITLFSSDTAGNRTTMTRGAAAVGSTPADNLVTNYSYNSFGDLIAEIDPRNNATTYEYDAMRRKTLQFRREGGATGTVRAMSTWWYDAHGSPTHEYRATGITSNWANGWQLWETRYTPTGKVRETVDPSNDVARNVYDGMDRLVRTIDGAAKTTQNDYDAAGQLVSVRTGVGTPEEVTDATFGYTLNGQRAFVRDARNNQTNYTYTGYDELLRSTFPDNSYEELRYDQARNVDRKRTRENLYIEWGYDDLDRRISERGIAADGVTPTPNIEWFRLPTSTYQYDLAGRLTQHANPSMTRTLDYDATGRVWHQYQSNGGGYFVHLWDGADNLYGLYFPDTTAVSYSYDALNRMIGAGTAGGTALINYDALSRRTDVTFADGSTQTYAYEPDDDLSSITHDFAGTADDVTYGYSYDGAGREVSSTISNPAYRYTPPVLTQAYGSANNLNQYPTIDGRTVTLRGDGLTAGDGINWFSYNELGMLRRSWSQDFSVYTIYDVDALGQRVYARYFAPGALDPGLMLLAPAHRQEVAAERIDLESASTGQMVAQGWRNHALGPNPDERLITVEGGVPRYPHTDRHGSTIALSQGGSPIAKFAYDAYGRTTASTTWGTGASAYVWRYTGQFQDPFTGHLHYKARDYAAAYGRFLQTDPTGYDDGLNLFAYVGNDPVNRGDPTGLAAANTCSRVGGSSCSGSYETAGDISAPLPTITDASGRTHVATAPSPSAPEANYPGKGAVDWGVSAAEELGGAFLEGGLGPEGLWASKILSTGAKVAGAAESTAPLVTANRIAGNAARDALALGLRAEGRTAATEVYKWTPFGKRFIDIEVSLGGKVLGGIEVKVGGSRYLPAQRAKDAWLRIVEGYRVNVVRTPR